MTYDEVIEAVHTLGNFGKPMVLDRVVALLDALGNPQNAVSAVHVAGTNGKGSVSTMLSNVFRQAGLRTGLTISPFVTDFRERIQLDGEPLSKEDFVKGYEAIRRTGIWVTEFELITALAFWFFREKQCDIAVVETGLGGRLDATNTLAHPLAAVLTKIGMDHADILGDTLAKIAAEKCGIITPGCRVITSFGQPREAMEVIRKAAPNVMVPDVGQLRIRSSSLTDTAFSYRGREYRLSLCGEHQIENAVTVLETLAALPFEIPYETVKTALEHTLFPARAEVISKSPLCVLDGAHNPDGAAVLGKIMRGYKGKIVAVIGMMKDKDVPAVLQKTLPHCRAAVAVTVSSMPARALPADDLQKAASAYLPCETAADYHAVISRAAQLADGDPVFVFGSLYLASDIRNFLLEFYKNF